MDELKLKLQEAKESSSKNEAELAKSKQVLATQTMYNVDNLDRLTQLHDESKNRLTEKHDEEKQ